MRNIYKYKKITVFTFFIILLIVIVSVFLHTSQKEFYTNKKHGFTVALTNNWVCLTKHQMNQYYNDDLHYASTASNDFHIIFTALKYKENYATKNNIPNPSIVILYSDTLLDPSDLVNSISKELVDTGNFTYDGGTELSPIGSLNWQSRYISAEINSLIVLQDYYAVNYNDKTYLIIATSFNNENLYEIYDLLATIDFYK